MWWKRINEFSFTNEINRCIIFVNNAIHCGVPVSVLLIIIPWLRRLMWTVYCRRQLLPWLRAPHPQMAHHKASLPIDFVYPINSREYPVVWCSLIISCWYCAHVSVWITGSALHALVVLMFHTCTFLFVVYHNYSLLRSAIPNRRAKPSERWTVVRHNNIML